MKTYLVSPDAAPHPQCGKVKRLLREAAAHGSSQEVFLERLFSALSQVLEFNHVLWVEPSSYTSRIYKIWPPYKKNILLYWQQSREADAVLLASYHETMVRICGKDDYGAVTVSVLKKYMREASTDEFSLLFVRAVIQKRFIGVIGLVAFRKDAFGESDVATCFELSESFRYVWNRMAPSNCEAEIPPHDADFFSLNYLPGMQNLMRMLSRVSREEIPILLLGETGTGKEGIANMIYRGSGRYRRPFIKINCGGIPFSLMESKLFGYQKGAFTGADKDTPGCFELADTGTLLLDELGELPMAAQAHLLRVLQERVIERVGSSIEIPVNVRIIAATNRNLVDLVRRKRFRQDLLYRLSIFPIYIPALRERPEDIPVLLNFFILQQARRVGFVAAPKLAPSEMRRLCAYPWPGNIREMQNAVTRAMLIWNGTRESSFTIEVGRDLFAGMFSAPPVREEHVVLSAETGQACSSLRMEDVEKAHIRRVLRMAGGRITGRGGAAELLDMNPSTLRARMRKLGISRMSGVVEE